MANTLVLLNQDYGSPGRLQITQVRHPETFVLEVFRASDWDKGFTDDAYAVGSSNLDATGNWITPVAVSPGTYTLIVKTRTYLAVCYFGLPVSGGTGAGGGMDDGGCCTDLNESVQVNQVPISDDYDHFVNRPKQILINEG
jgi:hypothetical protein